MAARPFDLVIFDCDGVLVDSERIINRVESRHLARLGIELSADAARAAFKGRTVDEIATLVAARIDGPLPASWLYDWGMHVALGFARELAAVAGVRDVVERCAAWGIPVCVASQAPRARVDLVLAITDLASLFGDRVFTASEVPRPKPAPDVFLLAAARMGANPRRTAVVEDSPSGVQAAVAAGASAFGYCADEDGAALASAGAVPFAAMTDLPSLLERGPHDDAEVPAPVARVRAAYEAFAAGEGAPLMALLADDVVYHLPGGHLGGGDLRGRADLLARLARAGAACETPPAIRLLGLTGWGDVIVSAERFVAKRHGRVLDQDVVVTWRLEHGRCVEVWSQFADQPACDRFWAGM